MNNSIIYLNEKIRGCLNFEPGTQKTANKFASVHVRDVNQVITQSLSDK